MAKNIDVPPEYYCPITATDELMSHPVKASCDHVFEHDAIIRWLIRSGKCCPLCRTEINSLIPCTLLECEIKKFSEKHQLLLYKPSDIPEFNQNNIDEGLLIAIASGYYSEAKRYLESGANPNAINTTIHDPYKITPLHIAALQNNPYIAQLLMDYGANKNIYIDGGTPLHYAACKGHILMVEFLLNQEAYINTTTCCNDTALHVATKYGRTAVVELLLQQGADHRIKNDYGQTPFHIAAENGYLEIVKLFIGIGANPNSKDLFCNTPLDLALRNDYMNIVNLLLPITRKNCCIL